MKKIIMSVVAVLCFLMTSPVFMASNITYADGEVYNPGDQICANESYYIESDDQYRNIMVLDSKTMQILDVFNSNASQLEVTFPDNTNDVIVVSTAYNENGILDPTTEVSTPITVSNCYYDSIVEEYDRTSILATTAYDGTNIVFTKPSDVQDYSLTYQLLNSPKAKIVNFEKEDSVTVPLEEDTIIQVSESYTDANNENVTTYYEIEVNPSKQTYFVRTVDSFDVKMIDKVSVINIKLLLITIILLVIAFIFNIRYVRARRAYKKEKIEQMKKRG